MAVMEPLRKSPSSRICMRMPERCCSRVARESGIGISILTYLYVRIDPTKKKPAGSYLVGRTPGDSQRTYNASQRTYNASQRTYNKGVHGKRGHPQQDFRKE